MSKRIAKPVAPRLHFTKPHVESFRRCLRDNGYTESSIIERIRLLAGWADWMHAHGFGLDNVFIGLQAANNAFNSKKRSGDTPASGDYLCDICTREGCLHSRSQHKHRPKDGRLSLCSGNGHAGIAA